MTTEATVKLDGWAPQAQPKEGEETKAYRQLIVESVFGLWYRKKEILQTKCMPPQPISLGEIWKEVQSRLALLKSVKSWPYRSHGKRWLDRRVNECACAKFYANGIPKIVAATAGMYEPSRKLFENGT